MQANGKGRLSHMHEINATNYMNIQTYVIYMRTYMHMNIHVIYRREFPVFSMSLSTFLISFRSERVIRINLDYMCALLY